MTTAVVEVGPQAVRGPASAPREWVSVAIECVDDQIAVLGGRVVEMRRLWGDLLEMVVDQRVQTLVLVFPTWWSLARAELVADVARRLATEVVVLQRVSVADREDDTTLVELSDEFVVIAAPGAEVTVLPRGGRDLAGFLGAASGVLIDLPAEVSPLAPALGAKLLADGVPVAYSRRQDLLRSVSAELARRDISESGRGKRRWRHRMSAVPTGVLVSLAAVAGVWAAQALSGRPPADTATALVVEGRVAVRVPSLWDVERITSGPGSARVRVSVPGAESTALHLTQSAGSTSATNAQVAETLRRAAESERPGVFVDLDPEGSVGGRPAVTYRELRVGSETSWAVVADGSIRIAIGCQTPPGRADVIRDACVHAVQSAQVLQ